MIERFMLNEELEERIGEITGVDYSGMLKVEDVEALIKDLIVEYDKLKEEYEESKEEQPPFNPYEEYDVSESNFH